jgi:hypothetical protein
MMNGTNGRKGWFAGVMGMVLCAVALLTLPAAARGAVWNVTTLDDVYYPPSMGITTLRSAIDSAASGDFIRIEVPGTIDLRGALVINKALTISGPGADKLNLRFMAIGGLGDTGFSVVSGGWLVLDNVSVTGSGGSGVFVNGGSATLTNCTVAGNRFGGVSVSGGSASLTNCTVSGNMIGVDVSSGGIASLTNCTVSGNSATIGWGIRVVDGGSASLTNCTVADNSGDVRRGGGGINVGSGGNASLTNSLIARNVPDNCTGSITDGGYNFEDISSSCGFALHDYYPQLAPLADNGGPTLTHALYSGSPAIDAIPVGENGCGTTLVTDQRDETRPQIGGCDIGAFELTPVTTTALSASTNPSVYGQPVTLTATVSGNLPVGTVAFRVDDGMIAGCEAVVLTGAQASCAVPVLPVGTHACEATFSGDTIGQTSSGSLTQQVIRAATATVITSRTPASSLLGGSVAVGFSVAGAAAGARPPPGNLTVCKPGASCTADVADGQCSIPCESYVGTATLTATYAGDANFAGSQSAGVAHTVNLRSTALTLSPATLDAGNLAVGVAGTLQHVILTNTGSSPLSSISIPATAGDFAVNDDCPVSLDVGDFCTLGIVFSPTAAGSRSTTLSITTSAGNLDLSLVGTGTIAANSIVVDPTAPTTLHAGLDGAGVYRSTDSGANWTAATTQPANLRIKALALRDSSTLYAATQGGGVFVSSDGGVNWAGCATQPANLNLHSLLLAADGKLYAGSEAGVFVSGDGCGTWTAVNAGLP